MKSGSRFDWEGITIAMYLASFVTLGGVVSAKVASFGAYFVN